MSVCKFVAPISNDELRHYMRNVHCMLIVTTVAVAIINAYRDMLICTVLSSGEGAE
jgi:hypothetical protein